MFDWYVFGLEADDVDVFVGSTPQSWTASFPPWKATQTQRERKDRLPVASFFRGELLNFGFHRGKWRYYCTRFPEGEITPSMPLPTGNMTGFAWPRCKSKKFQTYFLPNGGGIHGDVPWYTNKIIASRMEQLSFWFILIHLSHPKKTYEKVCQFWKEELVAFKTFRPGQSL